MPTRPLPKSLVERLRSAHQSKIAKAHGRRNTRLFLGRLENIDHRKTRAGVSRRDIDNFGGRVRELDTSRNFPKIKKVVIKAHAIKPLNKNAQETISEIRQVVFDHNRKFKNDAFVIKMPHAYAIGEEYIAMAKANYPTLDEVTGTYNDPTKRGMRFLEAQRKKFRGSPLLTVKNLKEIEKTIIQRTKSTERTILDGDHLFFLGIRRGKIVLVPVIDLY